MKKQIMYTALTIIATSSFAYAHDTGMPHDEPGMMASSSPHMVQPRSISADGRHPIMVHPMGMEASSTGPRPQMARPMPYGVGSTTRGNMGDMMHNQSSSGTTTRVIGRPSMGQVARPLVSRPKEMEMMRGSTTRATGTRPMMTASGTVGIPTFKTEGGLFKSFFGKFFSWGK